jgi:[ribosomal protein S18]-alanine N-acetyltransferase
MQAVVRVEPMGEDDFASVEALDETTGVQRDQLYAELARPWSRRWVARHEVDGVVGCALAWHVADELHVLNLATRSDRRRQGIGRALMQGMLRYARDNRVDHVLLEVRRSNAPAVALYRATGFFVTGVRLRYYSDDEDAVEMRLSLDPATGNVVLRPDEVRLDA